MKTATIRLSGLALIVAACLTLTHASPQLLALIGAAVLSGLVMLGFALAVLAGQVTRQELDEANGESVHELEERTRV